MELIQGDKLRVKALRRVGVVGQHLKVAPVSLHSIKLRVTEKVWAQQPIGATMRRALEKTRPAWLMVVATA